MHFFQKDTRIILDLGRVEMMAEVFVNGHPQGIVWTKPYELDITDAIEPGRNTLEIDVTNTWWNRLVGDERYPLADSVHHSGRKRTYASHKAWSGQDTLLPAGLLGPVTLLVEKHIPIELE
jgi:hypothetical protein